MIDILLPILITFALINLIMLLIYFKNNKSANDNSEIKLKLEIIESSVTKLDSIIRQELAKNREETHANAKQTREELNNYLKSFGDSIINHLKTLTEFNEQKLDKMRETIEIKLKTLQEDNSKKLDQMRAVVDEKLNQTLEKRLGESFKQVSERLELVHKGLGEMQSLASGVGDLKKVLTNVKTRGTLGEIQLENLLEQILTTEQYEKNVITKKGSNERVEFAIKMPGRDKDDNNIWLPIDAKFPMEDYQRLIDAYDQANLVLAEDTAKQIETRIKLFAKSIKEKYIDPPNTTDFAIMFLPIEGLYAEVLRRRGLFETLQRDYRVIITGPTTLAALLNSLHMGFRTLAVEKRSSEVWSLLGAIKTEFGNFGVMLAKTHKKLQEASNQIETAGRKSRTIERKLKSVQELPLTEAQELLGEIETVSALDDDDE